MRSRQRKLGLGMVKRRRRPAGSVMANSTILAEIVGDVIGIAHPVIVILVTGPTVRRSAGKLPVHMATGAIYRQMLAC